MAVVAGSRNPTPERWAKAVARALDEGVTVRQVNSSGAWVATSGTQPAVAYVLDIAHGIVQSCSCPAGDFGDLCKHAARWYFDHGLLDGPDDGAAALIAA